MGQTELAASLDCDGGAEHSSAVVEHEVDFFGGDELGGGDEVALVLAVLVVNDYDEFALTEIVDGFLYGAEY